MNIMLKKTKFKITFQVNILFNLAFFQPQESKKIQSPKTSSSFQAH